MWRMIGSVALVIIVMIAMLQLAELVRAEKFRIEQSPLSSRKTVSVAGIIFHDCIAEENLWNPNPRLENTTTYKVLIRKSVVSQAWDGGIFMKDANELTQWMKPIEPNANLEIGSLSMKDRFYIYNAEGGLLGFMKSVCE